MTTTCIAFILFIGKAVEIPHVSRHIGFGLSNHTRNPERKISISVYLYILYPVLLLVVRRRESTNRYGRTKHQHSAFSTFVVRSARHNIVFLLELIMSTTNEVPAVVSDAAAANAAVVESSAATTVQQVGHSTTLETSAPKKSKTPSDFLKSILGRPIRVKLNSGIEYRGVLGSLDGYLNIAMEQTEEYSNTGQLQAKYGDCFIRGNNGTLSIATRECMRAQNTFVAKLHSKDVRFVSYETPSLLTFFR